MTIGQKMNLEILEYIILMKLNSFLLKMKNQQVISFMNGDYDIYPWSRAQWWVERFTAEGFNEIDMAGSKN